MTLARWVAVVLGGLTACSGEASTSGDAAVDRTDVVDAAVNDLGWATDATTDATTTDDGVPRCVPGMSVVCACAGGTNGVQVCGGAGIYGACQCIDDGGAAVDAPMPVAITGPRLITPRSVSRAMTQRPTFRWVPPAGVTRARVTVARDRALTTGVVTAEATGASWRPTTGLPFAVWFWRVEGIGEDGGVVWTSPTWEFRTPRRDSEVDSSWGTFRDFNGDGYDDLVLGADDVRVYQGSPTGITATPTQVLQFPEQIMLGPDGRWVLGELANGDLNGDGLMDLAYVIEGFIATLDGGITLLSRRLVAHYGSSTGLSAFPDVVLVDYELSSDYAYDSISIFDADGDGYGDLFATLICLECEGCVAEGGSKGTDGGTRDSVDTRYVIYAGGPTHIASAHRLPFEEHRRYSWLKPLGDLDQDGTVDFSYMPMPGERERDLVLSGYRPPWPIEWPLPNEVSLTPRSADVDGDGRLEIIAATFDQVHLFHTLGLPGTSPTPWVVINAPETPTGLSDSEGFGASFRAGDVTGDGYADLLIGSPSAVSMGSRRGDGRAYLFAGSREGMSELRRWQGQPLSLGGSVDTYGRDLIIPGDLNGDGFDEMAIGALGTNRIEVRQGAASATGIREMIELSIRQNGYAFATE